MIEARIRKRFPPGPESVGFALDLAFTTAGAVTVLFGPSGSGKTLTLDCIAGFTKPDEGRIVLDGEVLYDSATRMDLRPQARRTGYVFQNYALFPHMSLRQNLEFAARSDERVDKMLNRFRLRGVSGRRPHEVSGGEKQRCSIARALITQPRILLLDEPARGLDAPLRGELYAVLHQVRAEFGTPAVLVTHDLDESFELGDEMLVMRDGRLVQSGSPRNILEKPANIEVARLLGVYNLMQVNISGSNRVRYHNLEITVPHTADHHSGEQVWLCSRPENLAAKPITVPPGPNQIPARLLRVVETPSGKRLEFEGDIAVHTSSVCENAPSEWLIEFPVDRLQIL
jgi:molybdate transport system ATP-binding protein